MVDIEPAHVITRLSQILPLMRTRLERLTPGPDGTVAAATAVRLRFRTTWCAVTTGSEFLTQLRYAARTKSVMSAAARRLDGVHRAGFVGAGGTSVWLRGARLRRRNILCDESMGWGVDCA
jgi:hypothetical protein